MTLECPRCKSVNPDAKRFCGDCGGPLDPAYQAIRDLMGTAINEQVRNILNENYRDQKIVELETSQAIAARLLDWAKLFGFFVGIPIAVVVIGLSVFGIKTYADFSALFTKLRTDVTAQLNAATQSATELNGKAVALNNEYEKLRSQLADTQALASQVRTLNERVDRINEKLGFSASSDLSPDTRQRLENAFNTFQAYLQGLGYKPIGGKIQVDVRSEMPSGAMAYYDASQRLMVIDKKYIGDPDLLFREYMGAVLYSKQVVNDPHLKFLTYYAIEEGLATYFPRSFIGSPTLSEEAAKKLGKDYQGWDLSTRRSFDEIKPNIGSATGIGTEVWGGAFWEVREALGQASADKLLFTAWFRLDPKEVQTDKGTSFVRKLIQLDKETMGGTHERQIRDIFQGRNLRIEP